ncbi:ATP-grasp ribosomal peptide maturase [Micromonospora sp. WMMA1363]|uniref:ATP-grasp ribosomal peptide maturase n=1 Tax=Micromonospora sp. WMMA1363 TaxID=3053985 RepID=UPI00259D2BEF|nr:ATP-grasp ribosomal peptide maturase [Micromonospora sp. WMMA1363]MDM4723366.1 ATP-grasp ribosomal peptide maturase [Micromonospora sp. WMMA1363]
MTSRDTVLVLTSAGDPTAEAVVCALARAGATIARFDTGDFPLGLGLSATTAAAGGWAGSVTGAWGVLDLERVRSVFYWRPTSFRLPSGMSPADEVWAAVEARHGWGGLLASLDARWVNDPVRSAAAEYKPLQLSVAARCGLAVPRTLVSNVHTDVVDFARQIGGPVVCKPLSSLVFAENGEEPTKTYTTIIDPASVDPDAFAMTAHLVQEYINKAYEVRVTAAGKTLLAVSIRSSSPAGRVDWRADYDSLTYGRVSVPEAVASGIDRFLTQMGLAYGAFDFAVTPSEQWIFLECNPVGHWLWLEHETGAPIADAIAELLLQGTRG